MLCRRQGSVPCARAVQGRAGRRPLVSRTVGELFGDRLRHIRLAVDRSQAHLAARAGLSTQEISALERGVNRSPQRAMVLPVLAQGTGLHTSERLSALRRQAASVDVPAELNLPD